MKSSRFSQETIHNTGGKKGNKSYGKGKDFRDNRNSLPKNNHLYDDTGLVNVLQKQKVGLEDFRDWKDLRPLRHLTRLAFLESRLAVQAKSLFSATILALDLKKGLLIEA